MAEDPGRWALLFVSSSSLDGELAERLTTTRFDTVARIADITVAYLPGLERIDAECFAHAVSGIGEQLDRWWLRQEDVPITDVVDRYVVMVDAMAVALINVYGAREPSAST